MTKLLVIDNEDIILNSLIRVLATAPFEVISAGTAADGWGLASRERPDVIILDLHLPDATGMELFERLRGDDPRRPVIFITAHGTTDTAIEAMKRGAFDYLTKPIDLDQLTQLLGRAFDAVRLMREPAALPDDPGPDRIIGRSAVMQAMCKQIGRAAAQDLHILITGESGTGKDLVARAIYSHSRRAGRPFLAINCAALPEGLIESELFGHERGAFTGADRQRIGKFEQCMDGTLLLDEIGDMPAAAQAKMLRVLQDQTFERVGGNHSVTTRVRILAATNQDLERLITAGRFRADLYYRLKVVSIHIPSLRERREDIPELAHHFLFRYARQAGRDVRGLDPLSLELLQRYDWPGNVRQLQNCVRAAVYQTPGGMLGPSDFQDLAALKSPLDAAPSSTSGPPPEAPAPAATGRPPATNCCGFIDGLLRDGGKDVYRRTISVAESEVITRALRLTRGHKSKASELLGISLPTLRNKIRDRGINLDNQWQ